MAMKHGCASIGQPEDSRKQENSQPAAAQVNEMSDECARAGENHASSMETTKQQST